MKTKLDLYLVAQAAAEKTVLPLNMTGKGAEKVLADTLKPLPLSAADQAFASQLFWSRRQRMQELLTQPLDEVVAAKPAEPKKA